MDHLLTVAALLASATFVTGLVLPLATRGRDGSGPRDRVRPDDVAAAQLHAPGRANDPSAPS